MLESDKVGGPETPVQLFSCEFCKIFKDTIIYGTTPVAATDYLELYNTLFVKENYPNFIRI